MIRVLHGDCRAVLPTLEAGSVQCCVTSPPYFGLRDYGHADQIGAEATPDAFVAAMVAVFREVWRVLADDGTCWLNLGDSYAAGGTGGMPSAKSTLSCHGATGRSPHLDAMGQGKQRNAPAGFKPKDLLMIPARVALALQADGWWLRSHIIWHKPNPMPESVTDRPTSAHESVFLLTKRATYFYDADAVREANADTSWASAKRASGESEKQGPKSAIRKAYELQGMHRNPDGRNARNVWTIATQPYSGAHFATMPPDLAERCIKAGSRPGDTVLDPFGGAGTTGLVADRLNRNAVLVELNPTYAGLARDRITDDAPLFAGVA